MEDHLEVGEGIKMDIRDLKKPATYRVFCSTA